MKELPYFLLEGDIKKFVKEFYEEFPFLDDNHLAIGDYFYKLEFNKIKKKYSLEDREYLLKKLNKQTDLNSNWYNRELSFGAILISTMALLVSTVKLKIINILTLIILGIILIILILNQKKFVQENNKILKIISIFEFINKFDETL